MARDDPPEVKPFRLFVAVAIPDGVKAALSSGVAPFRNSIPGARWTQGHGWHVTLKFLGATWPRLVDSVKAAVAEAAGSAERFETRLTTIGVFPSPARARVVWVGMLDPQARLAAIARHLEQLLAEDFDPERREFAPHLTLARLVPPRNITEFAPTLVGTHIEAEPFAVDGLVLYRSHLSPQGATYEPLMVAPLEG